VINIDDEQGAALAANWRGRRQTGAGPVDRVAARPGAAAAQGLHYTPAAWPSPCWKAPPAAEVRSQLVGEFNASNLLVVLGGLRALGVPLAEAAAVVPALTPVPGRMQRVAGTDVEVVVDYAHTPDALDKVLQRCARWPRRAGGRLWCVFGCGGNRDATKRPLMGAIAARGADHVVLTSDNPRDEAPGAILAQILAGVTGHDEVDVIEDRREAIHGACAKPRRVTWC
jgi:murE/murF fusion protein